MGRPRKPTALKILHGDFAKDPQRRNHDEPQIESAEPDCAAWIVGEARAEWKRVTSELSSMKVVTPPDRAAIEAYCSIYARWRDALKAVKKSGLIIETEHGPRENPACKIAARCEDQIHKYLCQFGLTPAARSRVNVTQKTAPARMRRARG
jgi:P27 family predicted phage terminase small subunit